MQIQRRINSIVLIVFLVNSVFFFSANIFSVVIFFRFFFVVVVVDSEIYLTVNTDRENGNAEKNTVLNLSNLFLNFEYTVVISTLIIISIFFLVSLTSF